MSESSKFFLRVVSLLLILAFTATMIISCGGGNKNGGNDSGNAESIGGEDSEQSETSEERIYADLPDANYNGYEFKILTFGVQGSNQWENIDLTPSEDDGDVVSDAVFRRNTAIEEKYNVTVKEVHLYDANFGTSLKTAITSGTNDYDLISPRLVDSAGYIQSGYFHDFYKVPNVDLTKPWYNQQGVAEMSICNKLYLVLSDTLLSHNDATSITIFNKQTVKDYGLEDPYTLVKEGKWTVDKLYDMAKATSVDLNGDGKMTPGEDQYGYLIWSDAIVTYLHSGGQRLVGKDENDVPVLTFDNEKTFNVLEKVFDLLYDENVTGNVQKADFSAYNGDSSFETLFSANRAAFGWCRMYMIPMLRAMETDFGIVPIPKIYEQDENYWSTVNVHHAFGLAIPITANDDILDRTTIILEALSAESKYTLQPAYYDISLKTKHSRDEESSAMLDLILSHRVIDIGDLYNFASFGSEFYTLAKNNDRNLSSFYEKNESKVNKEIDKTIAKIEALE